MFWVVTFATEVRIIRSTVIRTKHLYVQWQTSSKKWSQRHRRKVRPSVTTASLWRPASPSTFGMLDTTAKSLPLCPSSRRNVRRSKGNCLENGVWRASGEGQESVVNQPDITCNCSNRLCVVSTDGSSEVFARHLMEAHELPLAEIERTR